MSNTNMLSSAVNSLCCETRQVVPVSTGLHHSARVNVAPVCECWAPEFRVCKKHGALVFGMIRPPRSDIEVPMCSAAPRCDLLTADPRGTLKCYKALKVRFLTLCYTPSAFRGHFQHRLRTNCSLKLACLRRLNELFFLFASYILLLFAYRVKCSRLHQSRRKKPF